MKLLVTGAFTNDTAILDTIRRMGHDVVFLQNETDALPIAAAKINGVICNGLFLHHSIEQFTTLEYIQLTSAGFDRVPMDYVKEHNITIFNAKGVYSIPMAEFAIGGVLQLYKQSSFFYENQKNHAWQKHRGIIELYQKNVCIVGCGSVGNECAKRFAAFGCHVIGVDVQPYKNEWYDTMFPLDNIEAALNTADIVVLALPLTNETRHLMNSRRFSAMKNGAVLVNISRWAVVDTNVLIDCLNAKVGGAVLDVFEEEPLDNNNPLWDMPNVIITPHNSFVGEYNTNRLLMLITENLRSYCHGV